MWIGPIYSIQVKVSSIWNLIIEMSCLNCNRSLVQVIHLTDPMLPRTTYQTYPYTIPVWTPTLFMFAVNGEWTQSLSYARKGLCLSLAISYKGTRLSPRLSSINKRSKEVINFFVWNIKVINIKHSILLDNEYLEHRQFFLIIFNTWKFLHHLQSTWGWS